MRNLQPTSYSTSNTFPLRSGTRQGCPLSPHLFNRVLKFPGHSDQTRKRNKRHPNWKGGSKTVIVSDDMTVYIENPIDSTKKILDLISEFGKTVGYKFNIQKLRNFEEPRWRHR